MDDIIQTKSPTVSNDRECRNIVHVHTYLLYTEPACCHQHIIMGTTAPASCNKADHVHRIRMRTSYEANVCEGHWHWIDILTSPAYELPDGTHTHSLAGETSCELKHKHPFSGWVCPIAHFSGNGLPSNTLKCGMRETEN